MAYGYGSATITVTKKGFEPASVRLKAGQPVTLAVTRRVERTCATEIVVKGLGINKPLPLNKDFKLRLNLSGEVADKPSMVFMARSRWCKVDPLDPYIYNVGFQLIHIAPGDLEIFNRMMEKYGREQAKKSMDLRRSNKW